MSKHHQRGISFWAILIVVGLAFGGFAYKQHADRTERRLAAEADQKAYAESLEKLQAVNQRFDDALKIAQSTARIALSQPVTQLQQISREAAGISVHACLAEAKTAAVGRMNAAVDVFLAFMQQKDRDEHMKRAEKYLWDYMAALKVCADSRLKR